MSTPRLLASDYQADPATMAENSLRHNRSTKTVDQCFLCGRGLTEASIDKGWMIHMSTGCELIANDEQVNDSHDSQGCFPVGSECAKCIPLTHRFKF